MLVCVFRKSADTSNKPKKRLRKKNKCIRVQRLLFIEAMRGVMKEVEAIVEERFPGEKHLRWSRRDHFDARCLFY